MLRALLIAGVLSAAAAMPPAAAMSVDEAEAEMEAARACARAGDKRCVYEKMHAVLSEPAVRDALADQPDGATLYWMYYYRTALEVVDVAEPADAIDIADRTIALVEGQFPGQDNAAMIFHLVRAEAYASLGNLEAGASSASKAIDSYGVLERMGDGGNSLISVSSVKSRLVALERTYREHL